MIDTSDNERPRAFSIWLRSGRLPSARSADGIELKFNPWHDPETGRFTFVGAGRHYGQWSVGGFSGGGGGKGGGGGAPGSWDRPVRPSQPKLQNPASRAIPNEPARAASPSRRPTPSQSSARGSWTGGGFTGGGGGSFGGGGATAAETWGPLDPKRIRDSAPATESSHLSGGSSPSPNAQSEQFRTVVRNGYTYQIDAQKRTRRVSGILTVAEAPLRSRTSQRQAGGAARRVSDDGGHYIAARFNGPTEAFNHFAQDANFNRGGYRQLEGEWARDKRAGRAVSVKIVPQFGGSSIRPSTINVWWTVDGRSKSVRLPNERSEKRRGGN